MGSICEQITGLTDNRPMSHNPAPTLTVRSYDTSPGSHAHDHFQILWGLDGRLELEVEGRSAVVPTGGGLVIAPGQRHDFEARGVSRCLVLDTADASWLARQRIAPPPAAMDALAHYLATSLAHGLAVADHAGPWLIAQTWGTAEAARRARRAVDWGALTDWVRARLAGPLTAADLAARACLSESQFRARCQETLGCGPMQWVRQLRLQQARALRVSGLGVAEAARRSGYESASALTAALRRHAAGETRR